MVVGFLPIGLPLARAAAMPDFTRARIMESPSSAKMPDIWRKALVIGSSAPLRQSTVMEPRIVRRRRFC